MINESIANVLLDYSRLNGNLLTVFDCKVIYLQRGEGEYVGFNRLVVFDYFKGAYLCESYVRDSDLLEILSHLDDRYLISIGVEEWQRQ